MTPYLYERLSFQAILFFLLYISFFRAPITILILYATTIYLFITSNYHL
jgi:hypothetical protein